MNANPASAASARCLKTQTVARVGIFVFVVAFLTVPLFTVSSAYYGDPLPRNVARERQNSRIVRSQIPQVVFGVGARWDSKSRLAVQPIPFPQGGPEEIAIYQMDCTTPATDFSFGSTVCAKITGAPSGDGPQRRLAIVNPGNFVQAQAEVLSATQDLVFTLPTATTSSFGDVTIDNRGTWRAVSLAASDSTTRAATPFLVRDPQNQAADLSIQSGDHDEAAGVISFGLFITNNGPDDATNVQITDAVPTGTTFVSASQEAGPAFSCQTPSPGSTGITTCTIASLPKGAEVKFKFIYSVVAAAGTEILHSSDVASDTAESHTPDNTTESVATVSSAGGGGAACVLDCPNNITVSASTTQGGISGAIVTFPGAEAFGDCGTQTASPASGSFFPVGSAPVLVTSSTGDGICSFVVTVVEEAAPTISCPNDVVTTTNGCDPAMVDPGTPTANPSGVIVTSERSDGLALTDTYPAGVTTILWRAADSQGRAATCTQTITVNSDDSEAPVITAPPDVNTSTPLDAVGSCGVVVGETALGTAIATDNCSVNVSRTGVPDGNFFPVGTTVITYTATDPAGNTAIASQNVIVADGPPLIFAPPDASYVCFSEVPAADPSHATGPDIIDGNGNPQPGPPADSCSSVTVTVAETTSGLGSASSPLIITRTFTATDTSGHSVSAVQTITVIDDTAPTVTAPADASFECASDVPPANGNDAIAADNCAAPTVSVTDTNNGGSGSAASPLVITRTFMATDAAGNTASDSQTITVVDATAPVLTCSANIVVTLPANTSDTSMAVNFAAPTATDNCSSPTVSTSVASGSIFPVGTTTVTAMATDEAGNSSTCSFTVTVLYDFTGFFSPVGNLPILNSVNAGRAIPVKFSLSGDKGLNIFTLNSPYTISLNCDSNDPGVDVTETLTAGGSSLNFDDDQYTYIWKTESSWAGTCRQLIIKLNDGTEHRANFKFR